MNERTLNRQLAHSRAAASALEPLLQKAWANVLDAAAQQAAQAFTAGVTMVAAADWRPPPDGELFDKAKAEKAAAKTRRARERVLQAAADLPGISFDVRAEAPQMFLATLGPRTDTVLDGIRPAVAKAIEAGFEEGLSVPDTAALIREEVGALRDWQAAALARTDLNALSSAGNNLAVLQLNAASKEAGEREFRVKVWQTAEDDRVREAHEDADGQTVPVDQPFSVDGERLNFPGDPMGSPENTWNCRCVTLYAADEKAAAKLIGKPKRLAASAARTGGEMTKVKDLPRVVVPAAPVIPSITSGTSSNAFTAATVTVSVDEESAATETPANETVSQAWTATLLVEGDPTDDGRIMMPGSISWRETPMTLMALVETTEGGHMGAEAAGSIQSVRKLPTGVNAAMLETADFLGDGVFDTGEFGQETARMVEEGTLGYVSADLAVRDYGFRDPDTGALLDPAAMTEEEWMAAFMGALQFAVLDGVIMGATVVPFSAFSESRIEMTASGEMRLQVVAPIRLASDLLACAAGPLAPPADWFADPRLPGLTPITVDPDGRVYGHAATWDCHNGFADRCLRAAPSRNGYAQFHTGQLRTADGDPVRVGRVTVKPHAPYGASQAAVAAHYDDASRVAAFVRAYDDGYGIALAGVTRSDASPELLRDFLANPPSGDWRQGELLGFSSVPHPGLPVVVPEARLVASADGEMEVDALLLPPVTEADVLLAEITGDEAELAAIPFRSTQVVDEAWDGALEEAKIPEDATEEQLRGMYAWVDPDEDPGLKGSYKFIHHRWSDGEPGPAVLRACTSGLGILADGLANISDQAAVEAHLQAHVDEFRSENAQAAIESADELANRAGIEALAGAILGG